MSIKKWCLMPYDKASAENFAEQMGIPLPLAILLQTRGITNTEQAEEFFSQSSPLEDPFSLPDMEKAVERITRALDSFEKIAVYGDYDADGVTSTAMLYSYLESCGADVLYYIPEREGEGYGLNLGAIDTLREQGVRLIITVDNGISSIDEVAYAKSLGLDTVITDHHRPREVLPSACAIVDPFREDAVCLFRDYAGVGVAFKLIEALEGTDCDAGALLDNYADLAAIGTIGDIVPMKGENRRLVQAGLKLISRRDRLGVRALMEQAGLESQHVTAEQVAFILVPRINATGRIGSPDRAVRLLVSESPEEAAALAADICEDNDYRRRIENEIYEKAIEKLENDPVRLTDRVLVVDGEDWHHGVIGIVASRITERFGKPCLILSWSGEEAKGSGRSVEGFSLFDAVCSCGDFLLKFGGHPMAAGFSLRTADIPRLREQINQFAAQRYPLMPIPVRRIDCVLELKGLSIEIPESIRCMEPFGTENPFPVFGLTGVSVCDITPVGGGKHLRVSVKKNGCTARCMLFRTTLEEFAYRIGDRVDLAVTLDAREYNGRPSLSIIIREIKFSDMQPEMVLQSRALYEKYRRGEMLSHTEGALLIPTREDFAAVYRALRSLGEWRGSPEILLNRIPSAPVPMEKLMISLDVFEEQGLIERNRLADTYRIRLRPQKGKVDLSESKTMVALNKLGESW